MLSPLAIVRRSRKTNKGTSRLLVFLFVIANIAMQFVVIRVWKQIEVIPIHLPLTHENQQVVARNMPLI